VKSILRKRPSPAMVISLIALFVSLSGVSYGVATGFIDSREILNNQVGTRDLRNNDVRTRDMRNNDFRTLDIRNNEVRGRDIRNSTVQGRDVALDTLSGDDVKESELGKVASAAAADRAASAASATTAGSVGGMTIKKFFAKVPVGTSDSVIFRGQGFVLLGGCSATNASLMLNGVAGAPETNVIFEGSDGTTGGGSQIGDSDSDLDPADNFSLIAGEPRGTGTAVVSTSAGVVSTIVYGAMEAPAFQDENVCALRGTVTSG
jgi:hypothetical protein